MVDLLVQLKPIMYRKYVTSGPKNEPLPYVKLLKALYILLRSALLFCRQLHEDLNGIGLKVNPYETCFVKTIISGSQMTLPWYVNDFKISSYTKETDIT